MDAAVPNIVNIQKYSIHDGAGIRTTVFFKGCSLRCRWCHNPESHAFEKSLMLFEERCTLCGDCVRACGKGLIALERGKPPRGSEGCTECFECVSACTNGAREIIGRQYKIAELVGLIARDLPFYEASGGGVTLSGGEVMQQSEDYILSLVKALFHKGIGVDIDTCGFAPWARFERILPYADTFLFDIKHISSERHKALTGVGNETILANLKGLVERGAKVNVRIPLIENANADFASLNALALWLKANVPCGVQGISLLPYHKTGSEKYARLGETAEVFAPPSERKMSEIAELFSSFGFMNVTIGA